MVEAKVKRIFFTSIIGILAGAFYLFINWWGGKLNPYHIQMFWDSRIALVPNAIIVYLLIFPFLTAPLFLVKKWNDFAAVLAAYSALVGASFLVFLVFPTTMERSLAPEGGFIGWLFSAVRRIDGKNNLFPSLHVSSVVYAALVNGRFCPAAKWPSWACAVLISISTVLTKQHAVADVLGGVVFGVLSYLLLLRLLKQLRTQE